MILIGKIVGPHGIKGTLKVKPFTDFLERFEKNNIVKIRFENSLFEFLIEESFLHKNFICLKLKGIEDINQALKFRNCDIVISEDELKQLDDNEFYIHDLIGLKVLGESNEEIGVITDVISLASNDIYEIELSNKKKVFYPAVKEYIEEINIEKGIIKIKNYEDFFESNDAI
ncbi:MAG: ribosome maturation factor RimM [Ignavibacteria bacterium]|nr:ribosome maturation factor RimM [Ignavibacteria bacterium]